MLTLRRGLLEQIIACEAGSPEVVKLHTKAKLLDELVGELRAITNEIKFRRPRR